MSGLDADQQLELDRKISAHESQSAEDLATIRHLQQELEDYRQVMRDCSIRFEQAGIDMGAQNYSVQKGLAARRELDTYVRQLADQHAELLAETSREVRSTAETESERLRREKAGA